VKTCSLDPDVLRFEFWDIRRPGEEAVAYFYLSDRLAELHDELRNPRPKGGMWRWLERRSGARYMIMATLAGVGLALLLGMATLALNAYQAWVAYQAWQHPFPPPPSSP